MATFTYARWRAWAGGAVLLALPLLGLVAGCNPGAFGFLQMMLADDKIPAKFELSDPNKEKTIAIVTWFGNADLQLYPELTPFDNQLSERLGDDLRKRFTLNKKKVKIVPNHQVRTYQHKIVNKTWSPTEVGKKVGADYVLAMEINALALRERGSSILSRGTALIDVKVFDLSKPKYEQVTFSEFYQRSYPKDNPLDFSGSVVQFRELFVRHVSRELSRWFSAYSHDETLHNMEED